MEMTEDPYHPEPPFRYECLECEERFETENLDDFEKDDELIKCPECGGPLQNLTTPSRE